MIAFMMMFSSVICCFGGYARCRWRHCRRSRNRPLRVAVAHVVLTLLELDRPSSVATMPSGSAGNALDTDIRERLFVLVERFPWALRYASVQSRTRRDRLARRVKD